MEAPTYFDVEGRERVRADWNRHHVFARTMMRGKGEREWSGLSGILLPIYREFHNESSSALHANVPHCPKPLPALQHIIRLNLYENATEGVYDRFIHVIETVEGVAEHATSPALGKNAEKVLANLQRQAPFILNGAVIIGESRAD